MRDFGELGERGLEVFDDYGDDVGVGGTSRFPSI